MANNKASELRDLIPSRGNIWRYIKEGFVFVLLFGFIAVTLNILVSAIITAFGISISAGVMSALGTGGFKVAFVVLVSLIVQWYVAGFLVEYVLNSKAGLFKWARR